MDYEMVLRELRAHVGEEKTDWLCSKSYSNSPNTVKGAAGFPADPELESAALAVVEDPALAEELGLAGEYPHPDALTWMLLTLAARADSGVVERFAPRLEEPWMVKLLASIRRAAVKQAKASGAAAPTNAGAQDPSQTSDSPQKVSQVKAWLAGHPDADPTVLAPYDGQRAAAKVAAVRALGKLATPAALAVLESYASSTYSDAMLKELHDAWGRFDRREFAAVMFGKHPWSLGVVTDLDGVGAIADLKRLEVLFMGAADITPVAECADLRTLVVGAEGEPGLLSVAPILELDQLDELHLTRTTRNADLSPLAGLGVTRLRLELQDRDGSFLLQMPALKRLLLSAGPSDDGSPAGEADPRLPEVVVALATKGVQVALYSHQRDWVPEVMERAAAAGLHVVEKSGRVALTNDENELDGIASRLVSNILP